MIREWRDQLQTGALTGRTGKRTPDTKEAECDTRVRRNIDINIVTLAYL